MKKQKTIEKWKTYALLQNFNAHCVRGNQNISINWSKISGYSKQTLNQEFLIWGFFLPFIIFFVKFELTTLFFKQPELVIIRAPSLEALALEFQWAWLCKYRFMVWSTLINIILAKCQDSVSIRNVPCRTKIPTIADSLKKYSRF